METIYVGINEINFPERGRPVGDTSALQESIKSVGLIHPLTVRPPNGDGKYHLLAGRNRYMALQALGHDRVPVHVVEDAIDPRLITIDENLHRVELTAQQRTEALKERKEIYEGHLPESRARNRKASPDAPPSFLEDTARATGMSRSSVAHDVQIAKRLDPKAADVLREHDVKRADLVKIAKEPAETQRKIAKEIAKGKSLGEAMKELAPPTEETCLLGRALPNGLAKVFAIHDAIKDVDKLLRQLDELLADFGDRKGSELFRADHLQQIKKGDEMSWRCEAVKNLRSALKTTSPYTQCPYCLKENEGKGRKSCEACNGRNWITKSVYQACDDETKAVLGVQDAAA